MVTLLLLGLSTAPAVEPDAGEDVAHWDAERWIAEVDARADGLSDLRYSVRRTTERGETHADERWRFVRTGSRFRIDYFGDTARQLACDGTVLWDYVPARGAAVRVDLTALPVEDQQKRLSAVLEKVAVPGVRLGVAQGVTWTVDRDVDPLRDRPTVKLVGEGEGESGLRYWIDTERKALLRSELVEGDRVVIRTDASDHREIEAGTWFPHRVDLWTPEAGGEVRVRMNVSKVSTEAPPADLFDLALDPAIPVEQVP